MATAFIAALIALAIAHTLPDLARLRDYGWYAAWCGWISARLGSAGGWIGLALAAGLPTVALGVLAWALADVAFGLALLALSVAVLFYAWGPRDLDLDVDAVATAGDVERRASALANLELGPAATDGSALVDGVFRAALGRWFSVLFWFVVLGPAGALLYRLVALASRSPALAGALPESTRTVAETAARILDWPAAQLVTLALALAADFDAVAAAWRDFHGARGRWFVLDLGYLSAAARASVDADIDIGDSYEGDQRPGIGEMREAQSLVWRVLVVWGVVLALVVLAGWIG
jgi:AmpE protein